MTHLTLVLFIDAFRRDYVQRTSYIRTIAAKSRKAAMREFFGFLPRAGYFGGLGPSATGFTNMYCCDPERSPFGVARGLPPEPPDQDGDPYGMRAWIDSEARKRLPPFAALYASSAGIPLPLLPWFDIAETRAPWDRRVGYRSIFHELEDRGDGFFCCAWPETNALADHSDRGLVEHTLAAVTADHRLAFVHLQELDGIGHEYGPESAQILSGIDETDRLARQLVETLSNRFDRLDLLLFSDHGMVSVTGTVDVWSALVSAGLRIGHDVVPFLDSTMARFWFPTRVAERTVVEALSTLPGRILDANDRHRLDLEQCDSRNGELIFLAEPGHIITPNFFQKRNTVRGMHGYEPDCPDNMGIFLAHDPDLDEPLDMGIVGPTAVYAELRRSLGLGRPPTVSVPAPPLLSRIEGQFTQHPDPRAHETIRSHLTRVVAEARRLVPETDVVILTGSFGRDEGGVHRDASGRLTPVNDYDVLVLSRRAAPAASLALQSAGRTLAAEFGTDFVHFSLWPDLEVARPLTVANFDLRYGSRVLWGDPHVLDELPRFAAADLPLFEGLQLLYNRLAGLMTGLWWPEVGADRGPEGRAYLLNQTMKARLALGDWQLIRHHAYDASYQARHQRFVWLAQGLSITEDQQSAILSGYRFKLHPDRTEVVDVEAAARETSRWLVQTILGATAEVTGRSIDTLEAATAAYGDLLGGTSESIAQDNLHARQLLASDGIVRVSQSPSAWVRDAIYSSFPLLARAADGDERSFRQACDRLDACLTPPWPRDLTPGNWELVRARVTRAWLALVH